MKILFLNHNLIWRGSFFRCLGIARELAKQGHQVEIWTVSDNVNLYGVVEHISGVTVWKTPRWGSVGRHDGGYALVDILCRIMAVTAGQWDIVHAFEHRPNVFLPWMWKRLYSPSTTFFADWSDWWTAGGIITAKRSMAWMDKAEQFIEEKSKMWADGVTVISHPLKERALSIGIEEDRIALIPSGIDIQSFPCLQKDECRTRLSIPVDKTIFGFAGFSLWDMQMLADLFSSVKQRRGNVCLLIIGGGVEERQKDIFRSRFQIGEDVIMPGVVPFERIPGYLGCCDILLLPMEDNKANKARVPNKMTDYFAAGRPVIVSKVGDAAKYVEQHNAGIACSTDAKSMADACLQLMDDPERMEVLGKNARHAAEEKFPYSILVEAWIKFYLMKLKKNLK